MSSLTHSLTHAHTPYFQYFKSNPAVRGLEEALLQSPHIIEKGILFCDVLTIGGIFANTLKQELVNHGWQAQSGQHYFCK